MTESVSHARHFLKVWFQKIIFQQNQNESPEYDKMRTTVSGKIHNFIEVIILKVNKNICSQHNIERVRGGHKIVKLNTLPSPLKLISRTTFLTISCDALYIHKWDSSPQV